MVIQGERGIVAKPFRGIGGSWPFGGVDAKPFRGDAAFPGGSVQRPS